MGSLLSRLFSPSANNSVVVRILVLGEAGTGKTHFIDSLDVYSEPGFTRVPTVGYHDVTFKHGKAAVTLRELGGTTPSLAAHMERMLGDHEVVYYFVDVTRSLGDLYETKQRFMYMLMNMDSKVPVCLVLNAPPPPVESCYDGVMTNRRPYRAYSRSTIKRIFQISSLRAGREISTLYLTYDSHAPIEKLLSWSTARATPSPEAVL